MKKRQAKFDFKAKHSTRTSPQNVKKNFSHLHYLKNTDLNFTQGPYIQYSYYSNSVTRESKCK